MIPGRLSLFSHRDYSLIVLSPEEQFGTINLDLPALSPLLIIDPTIQKNQIKHAKDNF
jgi:hypothetical protein